MFDLVPNTSLAIINRCVLLITWWVVLLKLYLVSVKQLISWVLLANFSHCVKMSVFGVFLVRISAFGPTAWKVSKYGVFSGLHFPAFGLNTNLRIYFEYRKIGARKNSVFAHFSRSDWIRRLNIQFFSRSDWIFSLVTGKFRPEKLRIRAHFRQCLLWGKMFQKQPTRGILKKICSKFTRRYPCQSVISIKFFALLFKVAYLFIRTTPKGCFWCFVISSLNLALRTDK